MKEERKVLFKGSLMNLIIGILKCVGGLMFGVNALLVDSIYTFCDFVTDLIAIIGSKLAGRKPTKKHPFGFGRVEYLSNLLISLILFIVGGYLFYHSIHSSFNNKFEIPSLIALLIVNLTIILKLYNVLFYEKHNRNLKSSNIEINIEEGKIDIVSSILVGLVIIILQFAGYVEWLKFSDLLVSIFVVYLIFKAAITLLIHNITSLLGEVEVDTDNTNIVKEELSKIDSINIGKIELIKYGSYYKVHLVIKLDENITLKEARDIQTKVTNKLKKSNKIKVKAVNIDLDTIKK